MNIEVGSTTSSSGAAARNDVGPLSLDDPQCTDPSVAGVKAATLARLRAAGFAVAPGVVLPVHTALDGHRLAATVSETLASGPGPRATTVAVRSSSPQEDGALASAAGRYLTVLHVPVEPGALAEAASSVRASSPGAPMAVLVQAMLTPQAAGVAFGADPVTGDAGVVIDAVTGLADRLVAGAADPEHWRVGRDGTGGQRAGTITPPAGRGAPPADSLIGAAQGRSVLTADQAAAVVDLVERLSAHEGAAQDVEWALDAAGLHVVQCRPITALPTPPVVDLPPGTWVADAHRYPGGMTVFGAAIAAAEVSRGLTGVFARCGSTIERVEQREVAGRAYLQLVPLGGRTGPPPPPLVLGLLSRTDPRLRRRCRRAARLLSSGELTEDIREWKVRERHDIQQATAALRSVDVDALPAADLAEHLQQVLDLVRRGLATHFTLMPAHLVGVHQLVITCTELLSWSPAQALQLLTGLSPASDEPTRQLAAIAREIAADPAAVRAVLDEGADSSAPLANPPRPRSAAPVELLARLQAAHPDLGQRWATWRTTYGLRTANDDPGSPALVEIPGLLETLLVNQVRAQLSSDRTAQPTDLDDGTHPPRPAAIELLARARRTLAGRSARDRRRFEDVLARARAAYPVREDNVLWALSMPAGLARRAAQRAGELLHARGQLAEARDAVMLDPDTLLAGLAGHLPSAGLRPLVVRARAERAWVATHPLPGHYGPPPTPMPDLRYLPRAARLVNEALALDAPGSNDPPPRTSGALLTGVAASPGRATGAVRVVRTPADFTSLQPGEVLVCTITDPAWSVLFGVAGAVVADGGGVLTHSAIIAREHGIPAVLGTGTATRDLVDGTVVTVDGSAGTVLAAAP